MAAELRRQALRVKSSSSIFRALDLQYNAAFVLVKHAYKTLMRLLHPDKCKAFNDQELFDLCTDASKSTLF